MQVKETIFTLENVQLFYFEMAFLKNKRNLEAANRNNKEYYHRNNQSRDKNVLRANEKQITQPSEEIEGSATKSCFMNLAGQRVNF